MDNIITSTIKCIEKKIKLKFYAFSTIQALKSFSILDHFPKDYISKNGNTIYDFERIITRMESCNTSMVYKAHDKADMSTGDTYRAYDMIDSNACNNHTLCPLCASKKRNRILYQVDPYIKTLKKMDAFFYMITATIPNYHVDQLGEGYDFLRRSWTDFVKKGQLRKGSSRSRGESSKFYGSVLSIEIIPSKEKKDYFHIHAHILVSTRHKLDYSVISPEKRTELKNIYGNGYGDIPEHEFINNAKSFITDRQGNRIKNLSGFDIPASKITQEWFDCSGAVNFRIDHIRDGMVFSKKRKAWEYKTVEQQIPEVIKYEGKPWEFKNPVNLFRAWDAVSGKRRLTKAGVFTRKKRNYWNKLLRYHRLKDYFNEFYIDSDNIVSESKIVPFIWDDQGKDYYINKNSFARTIYEYPDLVKRSRQLRAKVLNWYNDNFNRLKKQIGKIDNLKWINKKKSLQSMVSLLNKYIGTQLIENCIDYDGKEPIVEGIFEYLGIDKKVYNIKVEPFQDNLFNDIESEIKNNLYTHIRKHHKINLVIEPGIEKRREDYIRSGENKKPRRVEPLRPWELFKPEEWQVSQNVTS